MFIFVVSIVVDSLNYQWKHLFYSKKYTVIDIKTYNVKKIDHHRLMLHEFHSIMMERICSSNVIAQQSFVDNIFCTTLK